MGDKPDPVSLWDVPSFAGDKPVDPEQTNAMGYKAGVVRDPEPEVEAEPEPLTAQQLEEIRLAAYEEGFAQGSEEGREKGLEEGRLQGLKEGHQSGLAQGKEEGLAQGQAEINQQLSVWQGVISQLQQPLRDLNAEVADQLITVVSALCRQLLKVELVLNPKLQLQLLNEAIEALPKQAGNITIKMNPEDLALISAAYSESEQQKRNWTLCEEPALARGACTVNTELSTVQNDLTLRMEQLTEKFILENSYEEPQVETELTHILDDDTALAEVDTAQSAAPEVDSTLLEPGLSNAEQNDLASGAEREVQELNAIDAQNNKPVASDAAEVNSTTEEDNASASNVPDPDPTSPQ